MAQHESYCGRLIHLQKLHLQFWCDSVVLIRTGITPLPKPSPRSAGGVAARKSGIALQSPQSSGGTNIRRSPENWVTERLPSTATCLSLDSANKNLYGNVTYSRLKDILTRSFTYLPRGGLKQVTSSSANSSRDSRGVGFRVQ